MNWYPDEELGSYIEEEEKVEGECRKDSRIEVEWKMHKQEGCSVGARCGHC